MKLKTQATEDKVLFKADFEDLRDFYKDDDANHEGFKNRYYSKSNEDEEELVFDENLESWLKILTLSEDETEEGPQTQAQKKL